MERAEEGERRGGENVARGQERKEERKEEPRGRRGAEKEGLIRIPIAIKKDLHLISVVKKAPRKVITCTRSRAVFATYVCLFHPLEIPRLP